MPRGDGTGPTGQGPGTGRGMGRGRGGGGGAGRGIGKGMGRMGGTRPGAGPGGQCVCPACGAMAAHQVGIPCYNVSCPKCGAKMVRGAGRGADEGIGRMGGTRPGAGPGGQCVCPACGATAAHQVGTPCYNVNCPKCGAKMVRG